MTIVDLLLMFLFMIIITVALYMLLVLIYIAISEILKYFHNSSKTLNTRL